LLNKLHLIINKQFTIFLLLGDKGLSPPMMF